KDIRLQLRLEDLLGFRHNPIANTSLTKEFHVKALDGHPTPTTPFLRLSTGASGVGVASTVGLAFGAADFYGKDAPFIHMIEGEGGMTPGRVAETMASAGTSQLKNLIMHLDWNQASIDSNAVTRENETPGDYVQWTPAEFAYMNDWNTILVENGKDFRQVLAAQKKASEMTNHQPTCIVYRTIKGWNYGIEGMKSHGGGHGFCSDAFYKTLNPILDLAGGEIKTYTEEEGKAIVNNPEQVEQYYWETLKSIRKIFETHPEITQPLADKIVGSKATLDKLNRKKRDNAPDISKIYAEAKANENSIPEFVALKAGATTTLRGELGKAMRYYNKVSNGAMLTSAADLYGSTSVSLAGDDFPKGFFNFEKNIDCRMLSVGGICEDGMVGVATGISAYGNHIGVCASYGAFIVSLGHIAARLHAIGQQSKQLVEVSPYNPFILVAGHTGIKTGEDGPTHADPQPLQLMQENFVKGCSVTLTPWDPQEIFPLLTAALVKRYAVITPFVTRPNEKVIDRAAAGLAPVSETTQGMYLLRKSTKKNPDGVIVLQGSESGNEFVLRALPLLLNEGIDVAAYYVSSAELFDSLSVEKRNEIFPEEHAVMAMGITGFTLPTMYRWIQSGFGRAHTLYPFRKGHYLGSGKAESVTLEAGLDGENQFKAIKKYVEELKQLRAASKSTLESVN
ncbi:MAG: hypothetical protein WCI97_06940, partial [Bacteroidota bacterium]